MTTRPATRYGLPAPYSLADEIAFDRVPVHPLGAHVAPGPECHEAGTYAMEMRTWAADAAMED